MDAPDSLASRLCTQCGLCCDGSLFADVRLQRGDDPDSLRAAGLRLWRITAAGKALLRFPQPCAAFDGCHCSVYPDRPRYCREFECGVFKEVARGTRSLADAQRAVRAARRRVDAVRRLLRKLGEENETSPLGVRFRRVKRRAEAGKIEAGGVATFAELSLAYHRLTVMLSEEFYPAGGC